MKEAFPPQISHLPAFDGPFDAYQLSAKDCDVMFASYPAGAKITTHTHVTDNVGVIIRGELILTVDGETSRFGVGDWYHVPANVEHAASFEADTAEIEFWFKTGQ